MKLLCGMQVRNGARVLPGALAHLRPYVDGFVILDDGSTDETSTILNAEPKMSAVLANPRRESDDVVDEPGNRQRVLRAMKDLAADWVLTCEPDMRVDRMLLRLMKIMVRQADELVHYRLPVRHLWDGPDTYRVDGAWRDQHRTLFFAMPPEMTFVRHRAWHGPWAPDEALVGRGAKSDYGVFRLATIDAASRARLRAHYERVDPHAEYYASGYGTLTDSTGLELETLDPGEGYDRASLPDDLRSVARRP